MLDRGPGERAIAGAGAPEASARATCLLLVPAFTELEWGIREELEGWAHVLSFDAPGVGATQMPASVRIDPARPKESLAGWREATARRGLEEVDRRGWMQFVLVSDSHGTPAAVRLAAERPGAVLGMAIGHASLSHSTTGERPPMSAAAWDALGQLARQGNEAFVRYGIAQMTRGAITEDVAEQMLQRFPDMELVAAAIEALAAEGEPIGDELARLRLPMLLGKHEGCLGRTDEGFQDIAMAFPEARKVICPEACSSSPAFARALREFCDELGA